MIDEKRKNILEYNHEEARQFFLTATQYCNIELPLYITFDELIKKVNFFLEQSNFKKFYKKFYKVKKCSEVNYVMLSNKDGQHAWRPLQIIHPVLYTLLVRLMTEEEHWKKIKSRFDDFSKNKRIHCCSLPPVCQEGKKYKGQQITQWLESVEQMSLELALEYNHLIKTDIADCYGSIYTHAIGWAIHGKAEVKADITKYDNDLGGLIDQYIQCMSHGQTNGIPQGSGLSDFIAEIILGYSDCLLSEKIKEDDYFIIRYRDDYRIFTRDYHSGKRILKLLSETLSELGLKLSHEKTSFSNEIIENSIKQDKLYCILHEKKQRDLQKDLLVIYNLSKLFPNSGSIVKKLTFLYDKKIFKKEKLKHNGSLKSLISIIVNIAIKNPGTYPIAAAILSKLLSFFTNNDERDSMIEKIVKNFGDISNARYLEIWIQRITLEFKENVYENNKFCQCVAKRENNIWNNEWIEDDNLRKIIEEHSMVNEEIKRNLPRIIAPSEVSLFSQAYQAYIDF